MPYVTFSGIHSRGPHGIDNVLSAPLLHPGETPPTELHQLWGSQHKKDLLEQVLLKRAMEMIRGLEYPSYEDRLREFGLSSQVKGRVWGEFTAAFLSKGECTRELKGHFSQRYVMMDKG